MTFVFKWLPGMESSDWSVERGLSSWYQGEVSLLHCDLAAGETGPPDRFLPRENSISRGNKSAISSLQACRSPPVCMCDLVSAFVCIGCLKFVVEMFYTNNVIHIVIQTVAQESWIMYFLYFLSDSADKQILSLL